MLGGNPMGVHSDLTDEYVTVSFTDSGNGISAEDMSNVFQPYFTTKKLGTGQPTGGELSQNTNTNTGDEITAKPVK
ncbi:MAG: hypothetical protein VCA55_15650 [Verrucomicrobiales bacterium]